MIGQVLLINFLSVLLGAINVIHDLFELNPSGLELILRGVTYTVRAVSVDLLLDIHNLLGELLLLTAQLTHVVVEREVLRLGLLEPLNDLLNGAVHPYGFLDCREGLLVLLDALHGHVNGAGVSSHSPGGPGNGRTQLVGVVVPLLGGMGMSTTFLAVAARVLGTALKNGVLGLIHSVDSRVILLFE